MKLQGQVVNWNDDKGFGFVEPNGGGERAFVHINAFKTRTRRPVNGDVIIYELVYDNNNRYKAENIKFSAVTANTSNKNRTHRPRSTKHKKNNGIDFAAAFLMFFFLAVGVSVLMEKLPSIIIGLYFVISCITFIAYAIDKSAAKKGLWRTPESTLHLLALIGGWPGAYLAQNILRHKSIKKPFRRVFWLTVVINVSGLVWLHTEKGAELLTLFLNNVMFK